MAILTNLGVALHWDKIFVTLTQGLNKQYDAVLMHLNMLEEKDWTINVIVQQLLDQESHIATVDAPSTTAAAAAAAATSAARCIRNDVTCYSCSKKGHFADKCNSSKSQSTLETIMEKLNKLSQEVADLPTEHVKEAQYA